MLGIIQMHSSVVTQQPPAANVAVGPPHPVALAVPAVPAVPAAAAATPAGRFARLPAQLAALPARVGRLGARRIIGSGATGIGILTVGGGVGGLVGEQISVYSQGQFADHQGEYAHTSAIAGGIIAVGVAVTAAGLLLLRSTPAAVPHAAGNQAPTAPSTPNHAVDDSAA